MKLRKIKSNQDSTFLTKTFQNLLKKQMACNYVVNQLCLINKNVQINIRFVNYSVCLETKISTAVHNFNFKEWGESESPHLTWARNPVPAFMPDPITNEHRSF